MQAEADQTLVTNLINQITANLLAKARTGLAALFSDKFGRLAPVYA